MYKTGKLEITSDVRSKPLGQKRKRGRPAKLPPCLTRSPVRDVLPEVIPDQLNSPASLSPPPTALYHPLRTPVTYALKNSQDTSNEIISYSKKRLQNKKKKKHQKKKT